MLIDWFTVVAQTINFLILVWLLKRFLYKPILDAIDARENRIAQELADADKKRLEARQERDEFERKNEEFNQQRDTLVAQMKDEINHKRQKLLDDAQLAADAISKKRIEAMESEQHRMTEEISRRAQDQVFSITRKTLKDLAETSLEASMTKVFTRRVREMNGRARQELGEAFSKSSEPARVRSTFELPNEQQAEIQQAINQTFEVDVPLRFEIAADKIGGIEVICSGRKIAWSIAEYLKVLEKSIADLIDPHAASGVSDQNSEVENEAGTKAESKAVS
jgi:F-type H+-transporting ATPase subunit b